MKLFFPVLLVLLLITGAAAEIYLWKDSKGTEHYTNQADTIPPRYRGKVKVIATPGDSAAKPPGQPGQSPAAQGGSLPMPPPPPAVAAPQNGAGGKKTPPQRRRHSNEDE